MKRILILCSLMTSQWILAETYKFDVANSTISWTGKKVVPGFSPHKGVVTMKSGSGEIMPAKMIGEVIVDMTSIKDLDLKANDMKQKLEGHLKSADFFDVTKFPTAQFHLTGATLVKDNDYSMVGKMTIKDVTLEVTFLGTVVVVKDSVNLKAHLSLDRTKYGIKYNSASFFDPKVLGDKIIDDQFELDFNLVGKVVK